MSNREYIGLFLFSLFFCLCLDAGVFAKEINDNGRASSIGKSGTLIQPTFLNNPYHFPGWQENWTAAGPGPSGFIENIIVSSFTAIKSRESSDAADGCYWEPILQGKSYKGSGGSRGEFRRVESDNRNISTWHLLTGEGIFYQIADGQIDGTVTHTPDEYEVLNVYIWGELSPALVRNIDGRETVVTLLNSIIPPIKDVSIGNESARNINKETTSSYERNSKLTVFVYIATDDRNDRSADGIYCFDGDGFVLSPTVNGQQEKCTESKFSHSGGSGLISTHLTREVR